jgi:hypothetical protein
MKQLLRNDEDLLRILYPCGDIDSTRKVEDRSEPRGNRMASVDELLAALKSAARANHRDDFDRHEADLLGRFGGFQGMPREIYQRYVEVDRAWPATLYRSEEEASSRIARLPLHARVPDDLISWLQELGAQTGCNRSDVLTCCLEIIRTDENLRGAVVSALKESGN